MVFSYRQSSMLLTDGLVISDLKWVDGSVKYTAIGYDLVYFTFGMELV